MDTPSNNADTEVLSIVISALPIAYVRPVMTDQGKKFAVCSTDSTQLAIFDTQEAAFFAAKQNELEPVWLN